jgi:hypothetical protein
VDCVEREKLKETLRIALEEMAWLYEEEARIAGDRPADLERFEEIMPYAKQRQQEAASNYHHHMAQHGCGQRLEIGSLLKDQLDKARSIHLASSARFDLLIKDGPSGLPHPDGSMRVQEAGKQMRTALQSYMQALKRFSEFTVSGTVPKDLLPPKS